MINRSTIVPGRLYRFLNLAGKYFSPRPLNTTIYARLIKMALKDHADA